MLVFRGVFAKTADFPGLFAVITVYFLSERGKKKCGKSMEIPSGMGRKQFGLLFNYLLKRDRQGKVSDQKWSLIFLFFLICEIGVK